MVSKTKATTQMNGHQWGLNLTTQDKTHIGGVRLRRVDGHLVLLRVIFVVVVRAGGGRGRTRREAEQKIVR